MPRRRNFATAKENNQSNHLGKYPKYSYLSIVIESKPKIIPLKNKYVINCIIQSPPDKNSREPWQKKKKLLFDVWTILENSLTLLEEKSKLSNYIGNTEVYIDSNEKIIMNDVNENSNTFQTIIYACDIPSTKKAKDIFDLNSSIPHRSNYGNLYMKINMYSLSLDDDIIRSNRGTEFLSNSFQIGRKMLNGVLISTTTIFTSGRRQTEQKILETTYFTFTNEHNSTISNLNNSQHTGVTYTSNI
ncbi:hypothetical protein H8356DRAFT_1428217 [Neocallimastix lanati (nom. inval.)]|nr:hypothetical protein H8356DRAFT_1428217 [Neocallimastix sp. JGI-2020a]